MDLKSIGLCPRRFESYRCRIFFLSSAHTKFHEMPRVFCKIIAKYFHSEIEFNSNEKCEVFVSFNQQEKSTIRITNLDTIKRPVSVVADNVEFRNIKSVKIFVNRKIKFNLLYDSKSSLNKKIKIEQVRREIN